jgi:hypothetical protein
MRVKIKKSQIQRLIREETRKILKEQGIDPVTGQPVTIGGQRELAAQMSAPDAADQILDGLGVRCDRDPGALAQAHVDLNTLVLGPALKAIENDKVPKGREGHTIFGHDASASLWAEIFRERLEFAFESCPRAMQSLPKGPKSISIQTGASIADHKFDDGDSMSELWRMFKVEPSWTGVGQLTRKLIQISKQQGRSALLDENGNILPNIMGG